MYPEACKALLVLHIIYPLVKPFIHSPWQSRVTHTRFSCFLNWVFEIGDFAVRFVGCYICGFYCYMRSSYFSGWGLRGLKGLEGSGGASYPIICLCIGR